MALEDTIDEVEDAKQESILSRKARDKLNNLGYKIVRDGEDRFIIINKNLNMHFGHNKPRSVFYYSINKFYPKMFSGIDGACKVNAYPTKIEIINGKNEYHTGFTPKNEFYSSFSAPSIDVVKSMLECAKHYKA